MAEYSMLWQTGTTGDGAAAGYTEAQTIGLFAHMLLPDATSQAVLMGWGDSYFPVVHAGATPTIDIATGTAFVKGLHHWVDATKTLAVTKPSAGDTGFRVILRASGGTTRQVRLAVLMNTDGVNTIPVLTQDATFPATGGTKWEIALYQGVVDTSGNIYSDSGKGTAGLTDERSMPHIGADANLLRKRQGGSGTDWDTAGVLNLVVGKQQSQGGPIQCTTNGAAVTVTFPIAFLYKPLIYLTCTDSDGTALPVLAYFSALSATQVDIKAWEHSGASETVTVNWLAIGPVA